MWSGDETTKKQANKQTASKQQANKQTRKQANLYIHTQGSPQLQLKLTYFGKSEYCINHI